MPIYINQNGQQSGPYEDHIVLDQLRSGALSPNDMGIRHGDAAWRRLGDMFPEVVSAPRAASSPGSPPASVGATGPTTAATAKKGGCLKGGLIGLGLILLLLGTATAIGSRFIPSVSCDLAKADEERIEKLKRDIEKAKSDFDFDEIGPKSLELQETMSGYEASKKYCDDERLRNNLVAGAGGVVALIGLLMAVVGLFVGRRR